MGTAAGQREVGLAAGVVVDEDGRTGQADDVHAAAIANRHVFNRFGFDELADVGRPGIDRRGGSRNVDRLRDRADLQRQIEFETLAGREREIGTNQFFEARLFHGEGVGPNGQRAEGVEAGIVRGNGSGGTVGETAGGDLGTDDDRTLRVSDEAGDIGL